MTKAQHTPGQKFSDYYVFCFMDGTYRIDARTEHQWNGKPDMPREVLDGIYNSKAEARHAIAKAEAK